MLSYTYDRKVNKMTDLEARNQFDEVISRMESNGASAIDIDKVTLLKEFFTNESLRTKLQYFVWKQNQ